MDIEEKENHCHCDENHKSHGHCGCSHSHEEHHHDHSHSCGCHHHEHGHSHEHHHHDEEDENETRSTVIKIVVAAVLLGVAVFIEKTFNLPTWQLLLIYLVPYLIVGFETLKESAEKIGEGDFLDEDFLMTIATLGALAIGFLPGAETQFPEAVFVMLFFQVGELFETIAEGKSKKSIVSLMDIRPDIAHVEREGKEETVNPSEVKIDEIIVVRPGERIPLDGVVLEGESSMDTVALTGESVPRKVRVEDEVISGCVNLSGVLRVKVLKNFGESTASKILELVENASENKSKSENFITRFAKVYTPIVVFCALALAFIPPFFAEGGYLSGLAVWLYRALTFLVVSCPCALVISVPLTFFGGIGGASRKGILVKGSNYLEALAKMDIAVFDKTGTLTKGVFSVSMVHPSDFDENELLHLAAHVERHSMHPIAVSLKQAYPNECDDCKIESEEEIAGHGMKAVVNGRTVYVGNGKLMDKIGAEWHECSHPTQGTTVHVAVDGVYVGHIVISDCIKEDSKEAIAALKANGVRKTVMLTGDHASVGKYVAETVGLDEYHAELLPADKVAQVERLQKEKAEGKTLAFVGDGINDAPVLARADVGIAMGGLGSDAAIEAADVVLMDDKPSKIALGIKIAKKTLCIARENVIFSIAIKVAVLLLATFGLAGMGLAVFSDVGVMVLAVLNALRSMRV